MKLILLLLVPLPLFCQVQVAGEMRKIMQEGNLTGTINLDTLQKEHVYGLGVASGLKGEILILDGKTLITSIDNSNLKTENPSGLLAAMLVYQKIEHWSSRKSNEKIENLKQLEAFIEKLVQPKGSPFAFLIKSTKGKINYHVIDWKDNTPHAINNHKQFAKTAELVDSEVTILGFYSDRHQGVFTHHNTKMHLHVLSNNPQIVGHIDQLQLTEFELLLPD